MDIVTPTPIQRLAIGPVLEGRDVIAKAETGTGKTIAFGAPIMSRVDPERASILALVLCPTRELAQQVADVFAILGRKQGIRIALVVGGEHMAPQVEAVRKGAQVVVGTPGRVIDLYGSKFLSFPWLEFVVLDEADRMLEIGFLDDVRKILSYLPDERQTMLFSATFPPDLLRLARQETRDPVEVATAKGTKTVPSIDQTWIDVHEDDKPRILRRLIEQSPNDATFLVFCNRREDVNALIRRLGRTSFLVQALHGGFDQPTRFRIMKAFREGKIKAMIATDVAARGLDISRVSHVVNASIPREPTDYAHRIGRTGRAGREGLAITLVDGRDRRRWEALVGSLKIDVRELRLSEIAGRNGSRQRAKRPANRSTQRKRGPRR